MTEATLFGRPLPKGGMIGIAAPASGFENRSKILRGVEWWESRGYRVKLGAHVFDRDDYVAGDEECIAVDPQLGRPAAAKTDDHLAACIRV